MKKYEFNEDRRQWDRYKRFHAPNGLFTEFDTGELIITKQNPNPSERKLYDKYGIQVVGTTDHNLPQLYEDEKCTVPIKPAWLNQNGMQRLAIDFHTGVAVRLDGAAPYEKMDVPLPDNLSRAVAYWANHTQLPKAKSKSKAIVSRPARGAEVTELVAKLRDVRAAVVAARRLADAAGTRRYHCWDNAREEARMSWATLSFEEIHANVLADEWRTARVCQNGFSRPRHTTEHEYLFVKGGA